MIPIRLRNKITISCYAMVSGLFADMHNPKCRGSKFSWDNFADMAGCHCEANIFVHIPVPDKYKTAVQQNAKILGLTIAQTLVQRMTE